MRISIVLGPFLPPPPAPTGAVEYVWSGLAREFSRRGHQVTIVCRRSAGEPSEETVEGVRYFRRTRLTKTGVLAADLLKDLGYSLRLLPALPPADVLILNAFFLPALAPILRPSAGSVVVSVQRMPKRQLGLYRRCARLALVSRAVEDVVRRQHPRSLARAKVIPNPIEVETFTTPSAARPREVRTIMYTGRIHPEKGLHILVQAWRALGGERPITLRLVGPWEQRAGGGGDDYMRRLRNAAGSGAVEFTGPITNRRALAEALWSAECYCYPSMADSGETFGVAPLEAMGTGLAPVVSDLACFRDFVRPGVNGLVFDHRADDASARLRESLRAMVADDRARERMGLAAAETARAFSFSSIAEEYLRDFAALTRPGTSS